MTVQIQRSYLAPQVVELIRDRIRSGEWNDTLPAERLLSEHLGVSRPTLRKALQALHQEGVLEVLHGRPTRILGAPTKRRKATRSLTHVRLLSPVQLHEMAPSMICWIDHLRASLGRDGVGLEMRVDRRAFSKRPERALDHIVRSGPDAVWILHLSNSATQNWFQNQSIPCLVAGSLADEVTLPSIDLDYRATCRHAAGILKRRDCRSMALLVPESQAFGDQESVRGFLEGAGSAGRILSHDGTPRGIDRCLADAMDQQPRTDGLLVARSTFALSVLTCLLNKRVRVPQDLRLIARDDDAFLACTQPSVSRYQTDPKVWARHLGRLIRPLLKGDSPPVNPIRLMPTLIAGESLGDQTA